MEKKEIILLSCVLLLAFFLRVYKNSEVPFGFFCDEASFGYNAFTISQNLRDEYGKLLPLYFQAFGDYKSPLPKRALGYCHLSPFLPVITIFNYISF